MSSSLQIKSRKAKWKTLKPLQTKRPEKNLLCIGESIWISSGYNHGENGMIEVRCGMNGRKQTVPYPRNFISRFHSVCGSDGNDIMIIDANKGKMRSFNVINKKYGAEITIPKFGYYVSSIMIRGYLHIMHGSDDMFSTYLVHSMADGTLSEFEGNHQSLETYGVAITKGPDDTFYKFGGFNNVNMEWLDSFYVGRLQNDDPSKPIRWRKNDHFTLKKPLCGPAYIQYNHWIIIFGGETFGNTKVDDIYILDVRSKNGWIQSPIKCPMKILFVAVLDHQQRVHLFTHGSTYNNQHYCIALNELIPDLAISPMKQKVSMKKPQQIQQHHDDEKGGDETTDTAKMRNTIQTLKALNESLRDEVERLKNENGVINGKMKESKREILALKKRNTDLVRNQEELQSLRWMNTNMSAENERLMKETMDLKSKNKVLNDEVTQYRGIKSLEKGKNEVIWGLKKKLSEKNKLHEAKVEEMKRQIVVKEEEQRELIENMRTENKRMRVQITGYQEEQKEFMMKIAELEDKVKELEMKVLDVSKFMEWDCNQIHSWIMGLEGGRFTKYEVKLKDALCAAEFMGEDLLSVNPVFIKMWGIKDKKDREALYRNIHRLVQQQGSHGGGFGLNDAVPKLYEGAAPTAFV